MNAKPKRAYHHEKFQRSHFDRGMEKKTQVLTIDGLHVIFKVQSTTKVISGLPQADSWPDTDHDIDPQYYHMSQIK